MKYVEDFFGPRTTQIPTVPSPQQNAYSDRLLARNILEYLLRRSILSLRGFSRSASSMALHVRPRCPDLREIPEGFSQASRRHS